MPRKRDYRIVDATYLDTAPVRETIRQPIPASASATFRSLEDADAWPVWLIPVEKVTWTSSAPFGVGTTRDIDGRAGTISEYFFDWEDGRRMSFYFSSGQVPLFAAFAEEYDVVPTADDSCELVWRYGFECHGAYKLLQPLVAFGFRRTGRKSLGRLAEFMAEHKDEYE